MRIVLSRMIAWNRSKHDIRGMKFALGPVLKRRNMTQTALADRVGIGKGFMSEIVSGKKMPSFETLERMLHVLSVQPNELWGLERAKAEEPTGAAGFAEPDATAFRPGPVIEAALRRVAPEARHPQSYRIDRNMPGFGLLTGDIVVVDLGRSAETGDLVVANMLVGQEATTIVRRVAGDWLVPGDPMGDFVRIGADAAVFGVICGEVRQDITEG